MDRTMTNEHKSLQAASKKNEAVAYTRSLRKK